MSEVVAVGERQDGQQIDMLRGQTLRVSLPEVRTAGFRWSPRSSTQRILTPLGDDLDSVSAPKGGAAQHHWDFRAEAAGTTELVFDYDRPWARAAAAARTFTVSVRVTDTSGDAPHPSS
jgi:predicted secreted protein